MPTRDLFQMAEHDRLTRAGFVPVPGRQDGHLWYRDPQTGAILSHEEALKALGRREPPEREST